MPMHARLHFEGVVLITLICAPCTSTSRLAGWRAGGLAVRPPRAQQHAHAMAGHCEEQTSTARTKARQLCMARDGGGLLLIRSISTAGEREGCQAAQARKVPPNRPRNQLMSPSPAGLLGYLPGCVLLPYPGTDRGGSGRVTHTQQVRTCSSVVIEKEHSGWECRGASQHSQKQGGPF